MASREVSLNPKTLSASFERATSCWNVSLPQFIPAAVPSFALAASTSSLAALISRFCDFNISKASSRERPLLLLVRFLSESVYFDVSMVLLTSVIESKERSSSSSVFTIAATLTGSVQAGLSLENLCLYVITTTACLYFPLSSFNRSCAGVYVLKQPHRTVCALSSVITLQSFGYSFSLKS